MKLKLLILLLMCSTITQAQFTEDFESYTLGPLLHQNQPRWNTWFGSHLYEESITIVQGVTKEALVKYNDATNYTDEILNLGNKTAGKWQLEFKIKIPTGKSALVQTLGNLTAQGAYNNEFLGNHLFFNIDNANPGVAYIGQQGSNNSFSFPHDVYFDLKFVWDLTNNSVRVSVNGVAVSQFPFASNPSATNLGGLNFTAQNSFHEYYVDDFVFTEVFYPDTILTLNNAFEQALIDLGLDTNGLTGDMLKSEAEAITSLDVSNRNIEYLYGIERFINLTSLDASNNKIQNFRAAGLSNLVTLNLENQQATSSLQSQQPIVKLKTVDLTGAPLLETLILKNNEITALNLSHQTVLKHLDLENNLISGFLNLSQNTDLSNYVSIVNNNITEIDLSNGNNTNMASVNFANNVNLSCIEVDDVAYPATNSGWVNAPANSYSLDCSSLYLVAIPDANFEQALIDAGIDTNGLTGNIIDSEAEAATFLNVNNKGIADLTGLNAFKNLTYLNISNNAVGSIAISNLVNLTRLVAQGSGLTGNLDLSGNTNLKELFADNNQVTSVGFSSSNLIENINIDSSNLLSIDVSNFGELYQLDIGGNPALSSLDVTQNPKLKLLSLENTQVTGVNLTQNPLLEFYYHSGVVLTSLDVSANTILKELNVSNCQLATLDLTNNLQLEKVWMGGNKMSSFDYSIFPNLKVLNVFQPSPGFEFTSIDLSNNLNLETLVLSFHKITTLDLSSHNKLTQIFMYDNELTSFNIKNGANNILQTLNASLNPNLSCIQVDDVSNANSKPNWYKDTSTIYSTDCSNTDLISIPDANFEQALIDAGIDSNGLTGNMLKIEAESVGSFTATNKNIADLTGIEFFTNITFLNIFGNNLTTVSFVNNLNLKIVALNGNPLTSLDISGLNDITGLYIGSTSLDNADISGLNLTSLQFLDILNISNLSLTGDLDLSLSPVLRNLDARNNDFSSVNIANGNNTMRFAYFTTNPNLSCIKVDDSNLANSSTNFTKDNGAFFTEDCNNLDLINIPDANFEQALIDLGYDTNGLTGNMYKAQAEGVTSLVVHNKNISSLSGIEFFTNLISFYGFNNNVSTVSFVNSPNLKDLGLAGNPLSSINTTGLVQLRVINLGYTQLDDADIAGLNIPSLQSLQFLSVNSLSLTGDLDLSQNTSLVSLNISFNSFSTLDVSNGNNTNVTSFNATNNPNLTCIKVDNVVYSNGATNWTKDSIATYSTGCTADLVLIPDANFEQALIDAGVDTNGFTGNILKSEAEAATFLVLNNKNISNLTGLNAFKNLTFLNISNNTVGNSLDISNLTSLVTLSAYASNLTGVLDLSGNTNLKNLSGDNNAVTSVSFSSSNLIENINLDSSNLSSIDVSNFGELYQLDVGGNPALANLDVTQNPKLKLLSLENTQVTAVNLTQNPLLEFYFHSGVVLTSLDVSANPILKQLNVFNCQLTTLDLTNNLQLERIWMGGNKMSSFDYTIFPNLKVLNVFQPSPGFEFTSIDLSSNLDLETLVLSFHKITTLDLSNHNKLTQVFMYDNELTSFNIKNGVNNILQNLSTSLNPNLTCVQVDDPAQADTNVTNGIWYKDAATTYSTDCSVLGNEDFVSIDPSVKVYPNPVKEVLNISAKDPITSVKLTDVNGKTILNSRSNIDKINVSSFKSGMYFLEIKTKKGISVKKIIKQ